LVVHPLGDAVAADQHVREQLDGQDRIALCAPFGGGDVAVEGERERLPLGVVSRKAPSRSVVAFTLNQWSKVSCQTTMSP
jgi:hypothetical protein